MNASVCHHIQQLYTFKNSPFFGSPCTSVNVDAIILVGIQASTLEVMSVAVPQSGRAKCPYDPTDVYAFVYSGTLYYLVAFYSSNN